MFLSWICICSCTCLVFVDRLIVGRKKEAERRAVKAEEELAALRGAFESKEKELQDCLAEVG